MDRARMAKLHAALGSEVRLQIVELVAAHSEMCSCELVEQLGLSQATISRHVSVLRDAGVLNSRRAGALVILRVDERAISEEFGALTNHIEALRASASMLDVQTRINQRCGTALVS